MKLKVHVIIGLNKDSIGLATYLRQRKEVVYVLDHTVKGMVNRQDFTFVDEKFIHAMDSKVFKIFAYEPPYKRAQLLREI